MTVSIKRKRADYLKPLISVVAPMYNEGSLVHEYCKEMLSISQDLFQNYAMEIILVNDGSKDNTYDLMLQEQSLHSDIFTTICLSRNFGLEGAVNAGIKMAKGDAIIVMDADLQDPPSLIPQMIEKWKNGADIVVCSRIKRSNDSIFKKASANLYYKVMDSLSGKLKLEKSAANFRLLSRRALDQVLALPESNSVFRVVVPFIGMKTDVIGYDRDKRFAGETKYNLNKMIPYALDSITGISVEPLRKLKYFILLMLIFLCIFICSSFIIASPDNITFVILSFISFCFMILFIGVAILAEYLAQIMTEVKGRPISIIYKYTPSKSALERIS